MSKIFFRHGTVGSAKTANLILVAHKYEHQGKNVFIFKPSTDTRSAVGMIESRCGLSHPCIDIPQDFDIYKYINENPLKELVSAILIDEIQFATKEQIKQLVRIKLDFHIPILCYGLKNSYVEDELFECIPTLLYYADNVENVKDVCPFCEGKTTQNLRVVNGKPIREGNPIKVGDTEICEDYYIGVCTEHYFNPPINDK